MGQDIIIDKINLFWKQICSQKENGLLDESRVFNGYHCDYNGQQHNEAIKPYYFTMLQERKTDNVSAGYCYALSIFWAYSKWLQFAHPENTYGYNNDWFNNTIKILTYWDGKTELSKEQEFDIARFFSIINFFQRDFIYIDDFYFSEQDFSKLMKLSLLDTGGKLSSECFAIRDQYMTLNEFILLLKEKVLDDQIIYLIVPHPAGNHANGLFKHGEYYYYYEPNEPYGEYKDTSIEKIAEIIFDAYSNNNATFKISLHAYAMGVTPYIMC
jgi:hypothetical protein